MDSEPFREKQVAEGIDILSFALEQSANVILITDLNGNIEYVNPAFTHTTGYTKEEAIGRNPRILKSGYQSPVFYKQLWETITNGHQWHGEFQNINKKGELFWETATITPVKNHDGKIIRYIAIKEDITGKKQTEEALKQSEEKYRSLIVNIPGIIYRCKNDSQWTMIFISNVVEDVTGYKAEEIINNAVRSYASVIHPDDIERVRDTKDIGIENFQQFSIEYRIVTRKNTIKWVSETGRPVYDATGAIHSLDGVIFDITDRVHVLEELKKAKNNAELANKAKSEFIANISHEIRTPLNSVLGFTELLEDTITDETEKQYLDAIKTSGKNLLTLINDLLDLSKIEAGKLSLYFEFLSIRKLLNEIHQIFSLRISQKKLHYSEILDTTLPEYFLSDESRLRQILINLVGNAVKFTPDGGYVTVKVEYEQGKMPDSVNLKISVIDTGIGIPKDAFDLIFESFRQHSHLDSRKYEGTGLGLPITKKLVEALNGNIFLESTSGRGSNFMVFFPNVTVQLGTISTAAVTMSKKHEYEVTGILLQDFTGRFLTDYKDFMPMFKFIEFFAFYRNPVLQRSKISAVFVITGLDHEIITQKMHYFREHPLLKDIPLLLFTETSSIQIDKDARKIADAIISMPSDIHSMIKKINKIVQLNQIEETATVNDEGPVLISRNDNILSIIEEFHNHLYPEWESFRKKQPLKEIRNFGNKIKDIGEKNRLDFLLRYGNALITAVIEFNIEGLRDQISSFPDIVKQLNDLANDAR
jgi:PAS domain S-box-containing protein